MVIEMWMIVTFIATFIVFILFVLLKEYRKKYKLGFLTLMLFGTFLMVLVDHIIAFIGGEPFIEITTDGLIKNATILGIAMIIPIFIIWIVAISMQRSIKHTAN